MTFKWLHHGSEIPGETGPFLTLDGDPEQLQGDYFLIATNPAGSLTAPIAIISVDPGSPPRITGNDGRFQSGVVGGTSQLKVYAQGKPFPVFQWFKGANAVPGATDSTLTLGELTPEDAGNYHVEVSNPLGQVASRDFTVQVRDQLPFHFARHPGSVQLVSRSLQGLSVQVYPTDGAAYQWYRDGRPLSNERRSSILLRPEESAAGTYHVVASRHGTKITSQEAIVTTGDMDSASPLIWQSGGRSITYETDYADRFFLADQALLSLRTQEVPRSVSWSRNGVVLPSQTDLTLWVDGPGPHTGTYTATLTTTAGTYTTRPIEITSPSSPAPQLISQSSSEDLTLGRSYQIGIGATSSEPMTIQWRKDGTLIAGAHRSSLTFSPIEESDAGTYTAEITTAQGNTTSRPIIVTTTVPEPPRITTQPQSIALQNPQPVAGNKRLSVLAESAGAISYQWFQDGEPIEGAIYSELDFSADTTGAMGLYRVLVSHGITSIWSDTVAVTRDPEPVPFELDSRLPSYRVAPNAAIQLRAYLANQNGPFTFQWYLNGKPIQGATAAILSIHKVNTTQSGDYTVTISNGSSTITSPPASVTVSHEFALPVPEQQGREVKLSNLSTRAQVSAGASIIVGFVVEGTQDKLLLLRGVGPTLATYGVGSPLADPRLQVYRGETELVGNDNWWASSNSAGIMTTTRELGAFDLDLSSNDAALLTPLAPGPYTVHVDGGATGAGIVLVEVYDARLGDIDAPRMSNLSARGYVGTDDNLLIAGFVIQGSEPKRVLIRGVGPSLRNFGVPAALSDPQLTILRGKEKLISNDNWATNPNVNEITKAAATVGAFPLDAKTRDAALLIYLNPGAYTAQIQGVRGATGEALVEVYELP